MLRIFWLILVFSGLYAPAAYGQDNVDFYTVSFIPIDEQGDDLVAAKERGILAAKRQAMRSLLVRMALGGETVLLPKDSEIEAMSLGNRIHQEAFGGDRYTAELIVQFDPQQVRRYLRRFGISFIEGQAPPARLIPDKRILGIDYTVLGDDILYRAWQSYLEQQDKVFAFVPFTLLDHSDVHHKVDHAENGSIYRVRTEFFHPESDWLQQETLPIRMVISSSSKEDMPPLNLNRRFSLTVEDGVIDWKPAMQWMQQQVDQQWRKHVFAQVGDMNQIAELELALISNNQPHTIALRSALEEIQVIESVQIQEISPRRVFLKLVYRGSEENFNMQLAAHGLQIRDTQSETELDIAQERLILDRR